MRCFSVRPFVYNYSITCNLRPIIFDVTSLELHRSWNDVVSSSYARWDEVVLISGNQCWLNVKLGMLNKRQLLNVKSVFSFNVHPTLKSRHISTLFQPMGQTSRHLKFLFKFVYQMKMAFAGRLLHVTDVTKVPIGIQMSKCT